MKYLVPQLAARANNFEFSDTKNCDDPEPFQLLDRDSDTQNKGSNSESNEK
jgi:hypothetical protein